MSGTSTMVSQRLPFSSRLLTESDSSVSKQKDLRRLVSPSAYLLFYRRRSDVPLGGKKFIEIISQFNASRAQDEVDSGEDPSLGEASFLRGSPRALTGVEAAHHPVRGSAHGEAPTMVDPDSIDGLPAYQEHQQGSGSAPVLEADAMMNSGLHASIEDEGIDVEQPPRYYISQPGYTPWTFADLHARDAENSSDGGRSDAPADGSSADSETKATRLRDFSEAMADDNDGEWMTNDPITDLTVDAPFGNTEFNSGRSDDMLFRSLKKQGLDIVPANGQVDDEEATEIHVEEGEGLKSK